MNWNRLFSVTMHNDLKSEFYQSAVAACEAFPESLARCVFYLTNSAAPFYVTPDIADVLSRKTREVKELLIQRTAYMKERNWAGMASYGVCISGLDDVKMIGVKRRMLGIVGPNYTQDMRALYVLDHEIGHHVVERGRGNGHESECCADAFAALRHIQRFGFKTAFFKYSQRASVIILGTSPIHYTQDIFDAARRHARRNDISRLSLAQTAALASEIVKKENISNLKIRHLAWCFNAAAIPAWKRYKSAQKITRALYSGSPQAYALFASETAKAMQAYPDDADVQIAGNRFFNYPPMKKFIESKAQALHEWKDILALSRKRLPKIKPAPLLMVKGGAK